eukprot:6175441-Pleurochrysis_carterae.AAC.2
MGCSGTNANSQSSHSLVGILSLPLFRPDTFRGQLRAASWQHDGRWWSMVMRSRRRLRGRAAVTALQQ